MADAVDDDGEGASGGPAARGGAATSGEQDSLANLSVWDLKRDQPTILILGNEGEGVRWSVRREATACVGIPRVLPAGLLASMARTEDGEDTPVP